MSLLQKVAVISVKEGGLQGGSDFRVREDVKEMMRQRLTVAKSRGCRYYCLELGPGRYLYPDGCPGKNNQCVQDTRLDIFEIPTISSRVCGGLRRPAAAREARLWKLGWTRRLLIVVRREPHNLRTNPKKQAQV